MNNFVGDSVDELFYASLARVIKLGKVIAPRGIKTLEIFPAAFELRNPRARVLLVPGRRINPAFAVAEAMWILSGSQDSWIFDYNSKLEQFANDGILRGAYGPRLRRWGGDIDQLERARRTLREDHATRRAFIQIYDPKSVSEGHKDVPCTISHHFLIRHERLHMFTTMRGQDLWLGLPYDVFYNTLLQELMAGWVGVPLGSYYYRADSLHLYCHDAEAARTVCQNTPNDPAPMKPIYMDWERRDDLIAAVLDGRIARHDSLASLAMLLESYRAWKDGAYSTALDLLSTVDAPLREAGYRWYNHLQKRPITSVPHIGDRSV